MIPLYPIKFKPEEAADLAWSIPNDNVAFYRHLSNICYDFPSILFATSATPKVEAPAALIIESLRNMGINVFRPSEAAPLSTLSYALMDRSMPLGLYLTDCGENLKMYAITKHGGYFDQKDVIHKISAKSYYLGVRGETDIETSYIAHLEAFCDRFASKKTGFNQLVIPFNNIEKKIAESEPLSHLTQKYKDGPTLEISQDGQRLKVFDTFGKEIPHKKVVETLCTYLTKERMATGTILGPEHTKVDTDNVKSLKVEGSVHDLQHQSSFYDLLLAWWHDGIIAHQGNGCFGDALLSSIFYFEAINST